MAVTILQTLVGLIFVVLGMTTTHKPPTARQEQWLYRALFVVLGFLFLTLNWIQYRDGRRQAVAVSDGIHLPGPAQNPVDRTLLQQTLQKDTGAIESNQLDLQQQYQTLMSALAASSSLDPNLRERLVIAKAKFEKVNAQVLALKNWESNLKGGLKEARVLNQIQREKDLSAAQSVKEKVLPYFNYAVKTLADMSEKEAVLKSDKSLLIYQGLPRHWSPEARAGKQSTQNAAEIKFETRAGWDFKIDFQESVSPGYEAALNITCRGGVLHLRNSEDFIETKVETFRGESFAHAPAPGEQAKRNIADALSKLAASELDAADAEK